MNYEESYKKLLAEKEKMIKSFSQMFEMQGKEIKFLKERCKITQFFFYSQCLIIISLCALYYFMRG